jgi:cytochrome c oxidase subunit III
MEMARISSFRSLDERLNPGGGGRGPLPPEPSGGGGGGGRGDGDDTPNHSDRLKRYRMGLYFMSGSILMLFLAFTTLFVALRQSGRFDPISGHFMNTWVSTPLPKLLLVVNTLVLLTSSVFAEMARRAAAMETVLMPVSEIPGIAAIRQSSVSWVKATAALGFVFLAGQAVVWTHVHRIAVDMDNPLSSSFIIMLTAGHALHLLGGLMVLLYVAFSKRLRRKYESRRIAVDVTAWYWHFMGAMWIFVLGVLFFVH